MTKYVTKPEPTELFAVDDNDDYRKHIQARRLGSIELMILLLQYPLTRSSISVQYLPSAPSHLHSRAVKPIHVQLMEIENNDDEEKPYWDDAIDKYFDRPLTGTFISLTYLITSAPTPSKINLLHQTQKLTVPKTRKTATFILEKNHN